MSGILGVSTLKFLDLEDSKGDTWLLKRASDKLSKHMREISPDIVITHDSSGWNGYPDHKADYNITVAAFNRQNTSKLQKLYHSTLLLQVLDKLNLPDQVKENIMKFVTVSDKKITSIIELNEKELENKFKLLNIYKSQFPDDNGLYYKMPLKVLNTLTAYESFYMNNICIKTNINYGCVDILDII